MVVFLSTQHSVEFHHTILENVLTDTDSETTPGSGHDIVMFKLHGDMLQKVTKTLTNLLCSPQIIQQCLCLLVGWIVVFLCSWLRKIVDFY